MALKSRPMRKDEILSLEIVLEYSNLYAEKDHWMEMGGPDRHIWNDLQTLLTYLKDVYPESALSDPDITTKGLKVIPVKPHDIEPLFIKE